MAQMHIMLILFRRGRKRKLKENFGEFVGINKTRRSTTSSIDQSVKDTAEEEPHINGFTGNLGCLTLSLLAESSVVR